MQINIKTKNITLTDPLREYIDEKIGSLEKFLQGVEPLIIEVEVGKTSKHHNKGDVFRAEVQIEIPGKLLRAEAVKDDIRKAIVAVKDNLKVQIKKYKK